MTLEDFLRRLDGVKGSGGNYKAKCPAHQDSTPSLSVSVGKDRRILVHCHAGCRTEDVLDAMGLTTKDLFEEIDPHEAFPGYDAPEDKPRFEAEYIYPNGNVKKIKMRKRDGGKYCYWMHIENGQWVNKRGNYKQLLYYRAPIGDPVFLVEGEKDVDTLHKIGVSAVSLPDGAKSEWFDAYGISFSGKDVFIIQDNDKPGKEYAQRMAKELQKDAKSVRILDLTKAWPELPEKGDTSDLFAHLGEQKAWEEIARLMDETPVWTAQEEKKAPILTPMTEVEAREPSYLISPYLPRGMLAVVGGVSGAGKTYLILSWAAAVSNGQRLPFQDFTSPTPPKGYVYYFSEENDPNTVIRPRLDLLGADLSRILILNSGGDTYEPLTMNDPRLEEAAKQYPPTMIVFDPIQSYLGAKVEMNKANEVRPVLDWLGHYAKRHNCTVVLISHMSKPGVGNTDALDRLLGSSDFRNAARSIVIVGRDPENKESRVFAHGKNSNGEEGPSQRYHISGHCGVVYDGTCDLTADDIVKQAAQKTRDKPAVTLSGAIRQLDDLLGEDGFATLEQVETMQTMLQISRGTLYSAKKELELQTVHVGATPGRKTWWLRPEINKAQFKAEHTPPPEQLKVPV